MFNKPAGDPDAGTPEPGGTHLTGLLVPCVQEGARVWRVFTPAGLAWRQGVWFGVGVSGGAGVRGLRE